MNRSDRPSFWSGFMTNRWNLLTTVIGFFILALIASLGCLFLQDDIRSFSNRKIWTKEELNLRNQKAKQRQMLAASEASYDRVEDGIHVRTGFKYDANVYTVIKACTSCHSAKLVTQNRATRSGWESMIRWMQATQGLPDLGKSEPIILDYLAKYYAPQETGRRANLDLTQVKWYILDIEN